MIKKGPIKLFLFSLFSLNLISCGPKEPEVVSYDGREYDISLNNDNSIRAKSVKVNNNYTLTISGDGESKNYKAKNEVPWNTISKLINKLEINDGVKYLGDYLFNNINLEYITLPESVTNISNTTFNSSTTIYSYSNKVNAVDNLYYYSPTKPTTNGKYFYLDNNEFKIWPDFNKTYNIFFIGNSFTFRQGTVENPKVPEYFKAIANNLNINVNIDFVVESSYKLSSYADENDNLGKIVDEKIRTNKYDYIILQEQSTTPYQNYESYKNAVGKLVTKINNYQTNCTTILYETWGTPYNVANDTRFKTIRDMENLLKTNIDNCAKEYNLKVNYVGTAFTEVSEKYPDLEIYADDNRHQSNLGAYLSALVHVKSIFDINLTNLSYFDTYSAETVNKLVGVVNNLNS